MAVFVTNNGLANERISKCEADLVTLDGRADGHDTTLGTLSQDLTAAELAMTNLSLGSLVTKMGNVHQLVSHVTDEWVAKVAGAWTGTNTANSYYTLTAEVGLSARSNELKIKIGFKCSFSSTASIIVQMAKNGAGWSTIWTGSAITVDYVYQTIYVNGVATYGEAFQAGDVLTFRFKSSVQLTGRTWSHDTEIWNNNVSEWVVR